MADRLVDEREPQDVTVEQALVVATVASYPARVDCEHCGGSGRIETTERLVHTFRGPFGADNGLAGVLQEIETSTRRVVRRGLLGWQLGYQEPDGKQVILDLGPNKPEVPDA